MGSESVFIRFMGAVYYIPIVLRECIVLHSKRCLALIVTLDG